MQHKLVVFLKSPSSLVFGFYYVTDLSCVCFFSVGAALRTALLQTHSKTLLHIIIMILFTRSHKRCIKCPWQKPRLFEVLLELPVSLAQRVIWERAVKVSCGSCPFIPLHKYNSHNNWVIWHIGMSSASYTADPSTNPGKNK